jgi:hypothetical protein
MSRVRRTVSLEGFTGRPRRATLPVLAAIALMWSVLTGAGALAQDADGICPTEAVWVNCFEGLSVSTGANRTATLHLRAHVSEGDCMPARVALTAAFIDRQGAVLCMGTHDEIAVLGSNMPNRNVHDVAVEVNPLVLRNFARWRNRPGQRMEVMFEPLQCRSPDGRTELLDNQLESAAVVQLAATLVPAEGGLSIAECQIRLAR